MCSRCRIGEFGDRFAEIAEAYGANVTRSTSSPAPPPTPQRRRRGAGQGPGDQGRPRHPQRDLDRRHQRHPGASSRRSAPCNPDVLIHRRRHQLPRLHPLRDRRLGRRRRHHRLAEGLHDPAGPGLRHLQRPRLGGLRDRPRCRSSTSTSAKYRDLRRQAARRRSRPPSSLYYGLDMALDMMDAGGHGADQRPPRTTSPSTPATRSRTRPAAAR